ncbi:hypothetical protein AB8Z38_30775 [Bradyrhizobium sp. LLZ17]|uniref:Uncharacterized protein n=1 Tax=Bradyrhizobium sp. LLZ17 TaxID=3239388 RepID=A0AB39XG33_9BRAD
MNQKPAKNEYKSDFIGCFGHSGQRNYVKDDGPIGDWRGYRGVYGTEILSARHRKLELDEPSGCSTARWLSSPSFELRRIACEPPVPRVGQFCS